VVELEVVAVGGAAEHSLAFCGLGHGLLLRHVLERFAHQLRQPLAAVHERLVKEINFWSDRYIKLQDDIAAGKDVRLTLENVRRTIDDLTARRESREKELLAMRHVVSATPVVVGGALVIPAGLLAQRKGQPGWTADADARARVEHAKLLRVESEHRRHEARNGGGRHELSELRTSCSGKVP